MLTDLQPCGTVSFNGTDVDWVVYVHALDECGPYRIRGAQLSLPMLPEADLHGLVGEPQLDRCGTVDHQPKSRWIGGPAHEIAHAMGVPRPPGCDEGLPTCDSGSILWTGYVSWPDTYLNDAERATLTSSPFIRAG